MLTAINRKTSERYGDDYPNSISISDGKIKDIFIRGKGWIGKKSILKQFELEEIEDLNIEKIHSRSLSFKDREKFKEYANKYGLDIASSFLWTCDIMKWAEGSIILQDYLSENDFNWFLETFGVSYYTFRSSIFTVFGKTDFCTLEFEKFLVEHGYEVNSDESMKEFINRKWGNKAGDKVAELIKLKQ